MNKEDFKEKAKELGKCYTDATPENKKLIHCTTIAVLGGLLIGFLLGRKGCSK